MAKNDCNDTTTRTVELDVDAFENWLDDLEETSIALQFLFERENDFPAHEASGFRTAVMVLCRHFMSKVDEGAGRFRQVG